MITTTVACNMEGMSYELIGEKIARLRESRALSQSDIARAIGVTPQAVQKWETGGRPRLNRLAQVADLLGVSVGELVRGTDYEAALQDIDLSEASSSAYGIGSRKGRPAQAPAPGKLPLISWVRAGDWSEAMDPFAVGDAEDWIYCPFNHSKESFILRIEGESMFDPSGTKSYAPGEYIAVDPHREPVNRSMVVAKLTDDNMATFKQLVIDPDGTKMLRALNPNWPKPFIQINGNCRIVGVVIGKWVPE